tara:strand:+ start:3755 stop:3982 length:228 start_codon:yes stop_codon:yes gene_type:complete
LAALALSFSWSASAEDLGVYGETFEITEEDLLHQIQRRLGEMRASGELDGSNTNLSTAPKPRSSDPIRCRGSPAP